jgi:hypothetical protein
VPALAGASVARRVDVMFTLSFFKGLKSWLRSGDWISGATGHPKLIRLSFGNGIGSRPISIVEGIPTADHASQLCFCWAALNLIQFIVLRRKGKWVVKAGHAGRQARTPPVLVACIQVRHAA